MTRLNKKRIKVNQGNSFIMVVATLSFLAVIVAAILVAVALCYRLKAYDINAKDNFYYLEQAMDEIYAGVGADAMMYLNQAYDETLEVMVYYDTKNKSYVTMEHDEANEILKNTYLSLLKKDTNYLSASTVETRLKSFLSYPYDDSSDTGKEGIQLAIGNYLTVGDEIVIKDLVLKREAKYSTVNAISRKDAEESGKAVSAADTFIQSITTDIVIAHPDFNVKFNTVSSDMSELYKFAMVSDMGIEITGKNGKSALGNKVNITGNVYAASDFYNKNYNENPNTVLTVGNVATTVEASQMQKINSYDDSRLETFDGVNMNSMYSGLYIDGATVVVTSDRLIVPGTIAALNCADVTISSINSEDDFADVWADGIVLDGYALKQNVKGTVLRGATLNMKARAYIYDDLEVNGNSANVLLNGEYYGYNYASTDNRTYTDESTKNGVRKYTKNTDDGIVDGQGVQGQAHYNSSAIILNGENTSLDFSLVRAMYIAGQSYIEVSKDTEKTKTPETVQYTVTNDGSGTQVLEDEVYKEVDSYVSVKQEADGTIVDNYTVDNNTATADKTAIQDYRTGEAISIKSNQLAYIPNWAVNDDENGLFLSLPEALRDVAAYQGIWDSFDKIPVIKTVLSGKTYYFLDFSEASKKDSDVMNQFIADYAALFDESTKANNENGLTTGEAYGLMNITDYDYFQVEMLKISEQTGNEAYNNIYTNSAITTKVGNTFTIKADSSSIAPLQQAINNINAAAQNSGSGDAALTVGAPTVTAKNITNKLQQQYKEVKWLLTNESSSGEFITAARSLEESVITPINHYFDFSKITDNNSRYCALDSGYGVWVSNGDVHIGADSCVINSGSTTNYSMNYKNGKVRGIVLAKGDVTFADNVEEFEGLIVTGGKVIVDNFDPVKGKNSMSFMANEQIIKNVLRDCDSSRGETIDKNFGFVCDIFRWFESQYEPPTQATDTPIENMRSISAVQFEDILSFRNWKKNVD